MKKIILSTIVIAAFLGYVAFTKLKGPEEGTVVPPTNLNSTTAPTNQLGSGNRNGMMNGNGTGNGNGNMGMGMMSGYKNGTYTGNVADAFYGNVQVQAVISGGKLTDVTFLQYPNDRSTSIEINTQAMPYLKQEAIKAQIAQVDIITGATQTSRAFIESLQSALDQAKS